MFTDKNRKLIGRIAVVVLVTLVVTILCFASCDNNSSKGTFSVTFYPQNGEYMFSTRLSEITAEDLPQITKSGYILLGWYTNPQYAGEPIVFPYKVSENVELYARWAQASGEHNVKFYVNGGSPLENIATSVLSESPMTKRNSYTLEGWYSDEALTKKISFPFVVNNDISLYAKWSLSDLTWETDIDSNQITFMWPAEEGVGYTIKVTNVEKSRPTISNGIASFTTNAILAGDVEIKKDDGRGEQTLYKKRFEQKDRIDYKQINAKVEGNRVIFYWEEKGSFDVKIDDSVFSVDENSFAIELTDSIRSISVRIRNEYSNALYYSFWSESITANRFNPLNSETFMYDGSNGVVRWKGDSEGTYTIRAYDSSDNMLKEFTVVAEKNDNGYYQTPLSIEEIFPKGGYEGFYYTISADTVNDEGVIHLTSKESEKQGVAYLETPELTLDAAVLSWEKGENFASYDLKIEENNVEVIKKTSTTNNYYKFEEGGSYKVTLTSYPQFVNNYSVPLVREYNILNKPTFSISTSKYNNENSISVVWDSVGNSKGYYLSILKGDTLVYSQDSSKLGENNNISTIAEKEFIGNAEMEKGGEYTLSLKAVARNSGYYDSPEQSFTIVKLATPSIKKTIDNETRQVSITITSSDDGVTFDVDNNKIKNNSNADDYSDIIKNSVRTITFIPNSPKGNTSTLETSVKALKDSTKSVFYLSSEIVTESTVLLSVMDKVTFKDNSTLDIPSYEQFKQKVEIRFFEGEEVKRSSCLEIGQTEYVIGNLDAGEYYLKYRKVAEGEGVPSVWTTLKFEKNSKAFGLTFENSTLKWQNGGEEGITGYYVIKNGNSFESVKGVGYDGVYVDIENTDRINYTVIVKGDYSGISTGGVPVLDSDPSEAFIVARLDKPSISIGEGIIRWKGVSNADGYTLFNDEIKLSYGFNNDKDGYSFDANELVAGDYSISIRAESSGQSKENAFYISQKSNSLTFKKLDTPTLEKDNITLDGFSYKITNFTSNASSYTFVGNGFQGQEVLTGVQRSFTPKSETSGNYYLQSCAIGDGVNYLTSEWSSEYEYVVLDAPVIKNYNSYYSGSYLDQDNSYFGWNSDSHGASYQYIFNNDSAVKLDNKLEKVNYSKLQFLVGENSFKVRAEKEGYLPSPYATSNIRKLETPDISWSVANLGYTISWKETNYATSYSCSFNSIATTLEGNFINYKKTDFIVGENSFSAIATAKDCISSEEKSIAIYKLDAPIISREGTTFVWNNVIENGKYNYLLNDELSGTTSGLNREYKLSDFKVGNNSFTLVATKEGFVDSNDSIFTVEKLALPEINWSADGNLYRIYWENIGKDVKYNYSFNSDEEKLIGDIGKYYNKSAFNVKENVIKVVAVKDGCLQSETASLTINKLQAPTPRLGTSTIGYSINWESVGRGVQYYYSCSFNNEEINSTESLSCNYSKASFKEGDNRFSIVAKGEGFVDSEESKVTITKLSAPTPEWSAVSSEYIVSWKTVENATSYSYSFNGADGITTSVSFGYTKDKFYANSDNEFKVIASGEGFVDSEEGVAGITKLSAPEVTRSSTTFNWTHSRDNLTYYYSLYNADSKLDLGSGITQLKTKAYTLESFKVGKNIFTIYARAEGCVDSDDVENSVTRLATPSLSWSKSENKYSIEWSTVVGASSYSYTLNSDVYDTKQTSVIYGKSDFKVGENKISLIAKGDNVLQSNEALISINKLSAPTLERKDTTFSWKVLTSGLTYSYTLKGGNGILDFGTTTDLSKNYELSIFKTGDNVFTLYASREGYIDSDNVENHVTRLATPEPNLATVDGGYHINWQSITSASGYIYTFNGSDEKTVTGLNIEKTKSEFKVGDNEFTIIAKGDNVLQSEKYTLTIIKLAAPSPKWSCSSSGYTVSWAGVENATSYSYSFNGTSGKDASLSYTYTKAYFNVNSPNEFKVIATADGFVSSEEGSVAIYKLASPIIERNGTTFSWSFTEENNKYHDSIGVSGVTYSYSLNEGYSAELSGASVEFKLSDFASENTFTLIAIANGFVSSEAALVNVKMLAAPKLSRNDFEISWDSLGENIKYICSLNGNEAFELTDCTTYSLSESELASSNTFTVYCTKDGCIRSEESTIRFNYYKVSSLDVNSSGVISWNAINELRYSVTIGSDTFETESASCNLGRCSGDITITVTPIAEGAIVAGSSIKVFKPQAPELSIVDDSVSWDAIEGAESYDVYVDGELKCNTKETSIELGNGNCVVKVIAKGEKLDSDSSSIDYSYVGNEDLGEGGE